MKKIFLPYLFIGIVIALIFLFWGADHIYNNTVFKWVIFQFPEKLYFSLLIAGSVTFYGYIKFLKRANVLEESSSKKQALSHEPNRDFLSSVPQGLTVGRYDHKYVCVPFLHSPEHQLILGPPGTGKSSTLLNAIIWNFNFASPEERLTSMLVIDIKGEFWKLGVLNGHDSAVRLDPTTMDSYGFDLYHGLNKNSSDDELYQFFSGISSTIIPEGDEKNRTFWGGARIILTGFLAYGFVCGLTFGETIEEIRSTSTSDLIAEISDPDSEVLLNHRKIRALVAEYDGKTSEAFQDITMNLKENLDVFDVETVKWFFSSKNPKRISASDLVNGTSFFLTIPGDKMEAFGSVFRLVINQCLNACLSAPETRHSEQRRIWFMVDEAGTIGKIPMLKTAMAQGRSKGIQVTIALQAISDLTETYGDNNTKSIRDYCKTHIVFGTDNDEYIRNLSSKAGFYSEEKTSISSKGSALSGELSRNTSSEYRQSIDAANVHQLNKRGEVLVLSSGDWFICERCRYFEIPSFMKKSANIASLNQKFHYHSDDTSST